MTNQPTQPGAGEAELERLAFLDNDRVYEAPQFTHLRTASITELFGWQPGETLEETIARPADEGAEGP